MQNTNNNTTVDTTSKYAKVEIDGSKFGYKVEALFLFVGGFLLLGLLSMKK